MKNLKKIVLPFCLLCSTISKADVWQTSNAPKTDVILGADFKMSIRLGRFEPFIITRICEMPIKKAYVVYDIERDQFGNPFPTASSTTYYSPRGTISLGGGTDFRFTDRFKLTVGMDLVSARSVVPMVKDYAGLKYKFDLSQNANVHTYAGLFNEGRVKYLFNDAKGSYSGYDRWGIELAIEYERRLSSRFSFNARVGYSYGRLYDGADEEHRRRYPIPILAPKGEFVTTIGLHYRLRPEFPEFERRERMPKTKPMKTSKQQPRHRQITVPCPAHNHRHWERPPSVFNRVGN